GIWVSGFFGSGKSHFAKLVGHLLADTPVGEQGARAVFAERLLHAGRTNDDRLAELLQQARINRLACHLVAFDIQSLQAPGGEANTGLSFLRAFQQSLGLSARPGIAEAELELQEEGKYEQFQQLYRQQTGRAWSQDRDDSLATSQFAHCLAQLLPSRHPTPAAAIENLNAAMVDVLRMFDINRVVERLLRWLATQPANRRLIFVADEVGAWAGSDLKRIEQVRSFVEILGQRGQGRIWLLATSQEKLSDVVANISADRPFLQRLEARFQTNVHLESSEVGRVIEDRILKKRPDGHAALGQIWERCQPLLRDIAEPPGLELAANYPKAEKERLIEDYPFLPYQLQAAADLFGGMRGVKVSSGARSMIKVAFDAARDLAGRPLGALVPWDQIFDSANRENEFADEQYLGSQGLDYIGTADRDVTGIAFQRPSRILKTLWLIQQSARIPRTQRNLARLLTDSVETDVLRLEQQVEEALAGLEQQNFVRREVATGQWKLLTQDELTVEKIVRRIAEDLSAGSVRRDASALAAKRLSALYNGTIAHGISNAAFGYGVALNGASLRNETAPVQLSAHFEGSPAAEAALAGVAASLDSPLIAWVLPAMPKLEDRLRRALAIEALAKDEEYRRIATEKTQREAERLLDEARQLREDAESNVNDLFQSGRLVYGGQAVELDLLSGNARSRIEAALADRIESVYPRFAEGDKRFQAGNIEKLFQAPPGERGALDPALGVFGLDGHVNSNNVLIEELTHYLGSSLKTSGADIVEWFAKPPYGWPPDLLRYLSAVMFVGAKVSAADKSGLAFDDPKQPQARALFGTAAFRTTRLLIVDEPPAPSELDAARDLLVALGHPPPSGSEFALRDAALEVCSRLRERATLVEKAAGSALPLPSVYDGVKASVEAVQNAGSRPKVIRALLARAEQLKAIDTALKQLEDFDKSSGFEQFRRSRTLLAVAVEAGLKDDPGYGPFVAEAETQTALIVEQRRVLEEWKGAYQKYRQDVLEAFRETYAPLRTALRDRSQQARKAILAMPEYEALTLPNRTDVRTTHLNPGRPLQEVSLPELKNEEQLLAANSQYSIAHLRLALGSFEQETGRARARVIELYTAAQQARGEQARTATWAAATAFSGQRFQREDQVDAAFDAVKDQIKALIREGKTVEVV
ncbi:MAG: BREX system P-loop protein BrxC, partial [Dehalococcoidia bacterium]